MICHKHLKLILLVIILVQLPKAQSQDLTLSHGFSHNDYWRKRPLLDALGSGYTHIEADIYLRKGKLIVAHVLPILRQQQTLEKLYFAPLLDCINGKNKEISCPTCPLTLMIDIKSDAEATYQVLERLLEKYRPILSGYENGQMVYRQVTVVLSGHKPYELLKSRTNRWAFIDDDLLQVKKDSSVNGLYQMASCRYSRLLKWDGRGRMSESERQRLRSYVKAAHKQGKKVRLWASPEQESVWKELIACGVDLINTNKLTALRNFLLTEQPRYAGTASRSNSSF